MYHLQVSIHVDIVKEHDYTHRKYYTLVAKVPCVDADEVVSCEFLSRFLPEGWSCLQGWQGKQIVEMKKCLQACMN
jgi:hypothetical protein